MPNLPKRQSLPNQAAQVILQMIDDGELDGQLPGERTLANKLQIGRDTLRLALDILEAQGAISPRQHGKSRNILYAGKAGAKKSKTKRVAIISPKKLHELPPWMLIEVDTLRELLNQRGFQLELLTPGIFHLKNPARRLEKLVSDSHVNVWILYQCPAPVQQWFQKNKLATIIRGYPHQGVELPCIDEDWEAAAYHAGVALARKGHRNIGLLMPDTNLAGLITTEAGLRRAIEVSPTSGTVHKMVDQAEPGSACRALERTFRLQNPPTAIVVTRSRHVLTLLTWLASHKLRVPHDLSLITLCYEGWFEHLIPTITHYHSDPASLARTVMRKAASMIEGEPVDATRKLIIPDYLEGQSLREIAVKP
ncbi:hypothetical protein NT6N_36120 [Oceaniferula spumae]|uniref:HTH gntR-type domain-containing protein n=1 Tax=Oceaniferula spumae TaxID=2979115 RepID=A0AAT9FQZ5_9BACT